MKVYKRKSSLAEIIFSIFLTLLLITSFSTSILADENLSDVGTDGILSNDEKLEDIEVSYSAHVQKIGWMDYVSDGAEGGTIGKAKRLESIKIKINNSPYEGGIMYRTHVQKNGWMSWVSDDIISGTTGEAKRLEAIQIKLTGELAEHYDVYYRVHIQKNGWLGWACNGQSAGSSGASKRLEAIQICLVEKGGAAPGNTSNTFVNNSSLIRYKTHVQVLGWRNFSYDGSANGSWGISKRLEGIGIFLNTSEYSGHIEYRTHVEKYGWMNWVSDGALSGTTGEAKRLEAIEIKLSGDISNYYDVYYRVHCQSYGWMSWVKNGQKAGTEGQKKRLEAIQILMCPKGCTPSFPPAPTNKMIDPRKPMIALTFDDGPSIYTGIVLNALERNGAKATFFVLGSRVNSYPEQLKRAYKIGCQIGNHTWGHPMLAGLSAGEIAYQMQSTDAAVKSYIGVGTTIMRPPGGSMNATVKANVGKPLITWSLDPRDWANRNSDYVLNYVLNNVRDGDIILLHDIHYTTAVASESLIPELIKRGYQLLTIGELAQYRGYNLTAGNVYNSMR